MFRKKDKPTIIITGASGFVGKYLLEHLISGYNIIAIARRSRAAAGISFYPNLDWIQWDIANLKLFNQVLGFIIGKGGAEFLIHLAGYYNFDYSDNTEYERTNITGTKNILELARKSNVKHFIFASSLAALNFVGDHRHLNESESPDAPFAYARSKKEGEKMCLEYSKNFKCSVVRFAAVFSDWCEYAPLYKFLHTWLSKGYDSRILAGKGQSAVSYIHIHDLNKLLKNVMLKSNELKQYDIFHASPYGSTTHLDLYTIATRDYYGETIKPIFLPKLLAYPGIIARQIMGKMGITEESFERLWMVKYIDEKLNIDSTYTQMTLDWTPTPRYQIERRMLFLLVNLKSHSQEWHLRNEELMKRASMRPNLKIYEHLLNMQDDILFKLGEKVLTDKETNIFTNFRIMDWKEFHSYISQIYYLILATVRSNDRSIMITYIEDLSMSRFAAGFGCEEITSLMYLLNEIIVSELLKIKELITLKQEIYDYIGLSIQLAIDETENIYEDLEKKLSPEKIASIHSLKEVENRKKFIEKLGTFYHDTEENPEKERY